MKWRALALLACLAVAACAPVYLADLDKAASLTGHMTGVGTVGPFSLGSGLANIRFLPTKTTASSIGDVNVQSGFIVYDSGTNENLSFLSGSGDNSGSNQQFSLAGADANYPLYQYDVTNTINNQASVMVFHWDPTTPGNDTFQQFVATLPSGGMTSFASTSLNGLFAGVSLIGGSILPAQPPSYDSFAVLGVSAGQFGTASNGAGGTLSAIGFTSVTFTPPIPTTRSMYYLSADNKLCYASFYSSGWQCLQWQNIAAPTATLLPGVSNRIDAVLTSGDLLSTQDGTLRLYDSTGSQVFSKPLNGLQFCYEAYIGSTACVFFSLPISLQHNQWVFSVYAIPTLSMRDLGK